MLLFKVVFTDVIRVAVAFRFETVVNLFWTFQFPLTHVKDLALDPEQIALIIYCLSRTRLFSSKRAGIRIDTFTTLV